MKFIKIKGPRETRGPGFEGKIFTGRPEFDKVGGIGWKIRQLRALVDVLLVAKVSFENQLAVIWCP